MSKGAVSSVSLTGAGQFVGTPDYSAPEQIQGLAVDGRADQYALACVAYQLLAGVVPFGRDQGMAVLFAHLSAAPPSLASRRPDLPPGADQVLARALAKAPEKRYGCCRDFADALREALGLAPYIPAGPLPHQVTGHPRPPRRCLGSPGLPRPGTGRQASRLIWRQPRAQAPFRSFLPFIAAVRRARSSPRRRRTRPIRGTCPQRRSQARAADTLAATGTPPRTTPASLRRGNWSRRARRRPAGAAAAGPGPAGPAPVLPARVARRGPGAPGRRVRRVHVPVPAAR